MSDMEEQPRDETQVPYTFHDTDGRIVQTGAMPRWMLATQEDHLPAGILAIEVESDLFRDYVLDGAAVPRPANTTVQSGMKLVNLPNPATVAINGTAPQQVTDGEVEFEFTQPGTYTVVVSAWPMLDATFQVTQP